MKIDTTKPIYTITGTRVDFIEINEFDRIKVAIPDDGKSFRLFDRNGVHYKNTVPPITNVNLGGDLFVGDKSAYLIGVNDDNEIKVEVEGDTKSFRLFYLDGSHKNGTLPNLTAGATSAATEAGEDDEDTAPVSGRSFFEALASMLGGGIVVIRLG